MKTNFDASTKEINRINKDVAYAIVEVAGGNVLNINNRRTLECNRKCDLLNPSFVVKNKVCRALINSIKLDV